ncbi:uncharacterized protein LOC135417653 [Pseudopipra pipra]|uniref:uncharacterized protein LOC135417653 n=1 Tax=Pseudopipra pipra TaxID=415032 RepID=UPI003138AD70
MKPTSFQITSTWTVGLLISIVLSQSSTYEGPWSNAYIEVHVGDSGDFPEMEVYILHNKQPYTPDQGYLIAQKGDQFQIGCREVEGLIGKTDKLTLIIKFWPDESKQDLITYSQVKRGQPIVWIQRTGPISCQWDSFEGDRAQCEILFELNHSVTFTCNREGNPPGNYTVIKRISLAKDPIVDPSREITPQVECRRIHNFTLIGPQVIRQSNELKLLLDPTYSLKKVQMNIQTDITHLQEDCRPFIQHSLKGWNAWVTTRSHRKRTQRDISGWVGTGFGILNTIDQEVLVNKLSTVTSNLGKL